MGPHSLQFSPQGYFQIIMQQNKAQREKVSLHGEYRSWIKDFQGDYDFWFRVYMVWIHTKM